jgi:hypothetical protein
MKFMVEVDDFYLDEESELAPALSGHVIRTVVSQIWDKIEKKVDEAIRISVQAKIEQELTAKINIRIADIFASETIKKDGKDVSISDYIKDRFVNNSGWNSPHETITKIAKEYGNEMKKRYDYFYANQIVQQMHTIGVLKEEVFANLIENKKS